MSVTKIRGWGGGIVMEEPTFKQTAQKNAESV